MTLLHPLWQPPTSGQHTVWYMYNISFHTGWKCSTCVFSSSDAPQHIRVARHLGRNHLRHDQWIGATNIFISLCQHLCRRCSLVFTWYYFLNIAVLFWKITFLSTLQVFTNRDKDLIRQRCYFFCLMLVVMASVYFVTIFLQVCSYTCFCALAHTDTISSVRAKGLSLTGSRVFYPSFSARVSLSVSLERLWPWSWGWKPSPQWWNKWVIHLITVLTKLS